MKTAEYEINKPFYGHKVGETVTISVDKKGTPIDQMWRRRLKAAKIDNCISLKKAVSKTKSKTEIEKGI